MYQCFEMACRLWQLAFWGSGCKSFCLFASPCSFVPAAASTHALIFLRSCRSSEKAMELDGSELPCTQKSPGSVDWLTCQKPQGWAKNPHVSRCGTRHGTMRTSQLVRDCYQSLKVTVLFCPSQVSCAFGYCTNSRLMDLVSCGWLGSTVG